MSKTVLGLWNFSNDEFHAPIRVDLGKKIIRKALKKGIKDFDTAYSYTNSDTILYSVLKEQNALYDVKINSKIMPTPTFTKKAENILKRLHRDYLDSLLLHWPGDEKATFDALKQLEKLKERNLVMAMGVSNFPDNLLKKTAKDFELEIHQRPLSLLWAKPLNIEKELNISVMAYAPLCMGLLSDKYFGSELNDKRKDLECFNSQEFKPLKERIVLLKEKYETSAESIALSFVFALEPSFIVRGFDSPNRLETANETVKLEYNDFKNLKDLAENLFFSLKSDNIFSHNYLRT